MISPGLHGRGFTTEHNVELLSLSTYSLNYQLPVQTDTGNMQGGGSKPVYSNSVLLKQVITLKTKPWALPPAFGQEYQELIL